MTEARTLVLQEPADDQKKIVLDLYGVVDAKNIPRQIKMEKSTVLALDDVVRNIYHVPKKWRNYWIDLGYDEIKKIMWDKDGHPYIDVAATMKPKHIIRVMLKEKHAEQALDLLLTATDFCDYCRGPLNTSIDASEWFGYCDFGGGTIADVRECPYCEQENIRWDREFLKEHSKLGLKVR